MGILLIESFIVAILIAVVFALIMDSFKLRKEFLEIKAELTVRTKEAERLIEELFKRNVNLEAKLITSRKGKQ